MASEDQCGKHPSPRAWLLFTKMHHAWRKHHLRGFVCSQLRRHARPPSLQPMPRRQLLLAEVPEGTFIEKINLILLLKAKRDVEPLISRGRILEILPLPKVDANIDGLSLVEDFDLFFACRSLALSSKFECYDCLVCAGILAVP